MRIYRYDFMTAVAFLLLTLSNFVYAQAPLRLVPVAPCRLIDTRNQGGPIQGGAFRTFDLPQLALSSGCAGISSAGAYSLNVTVAPYHGQPLGYLTIWPTGEAQPAVSLLNSLDGRIKANAAVVPSGSNGEVNVYASGTTDVVLDLDGYFDANDSFALAFFPMTPCRVADTRNANGPLGGPFLSGGVERDFPLLLSECNIPITATAYWLNFTVVPIQNGPVGDLIAWPAGGSEPKVSTLNDLTGTVVANAAIVFAGSDNQTAVSASNSTNLVIDINGYFAPAESGPNPLSLYVTNPCRVIDTRQGHGAFSGELTVDVQNSGCASPTAQAYVLNATVVPQGALGYVSFWPDGQGQPLVSTLNAIDGSITSNMAVVQNINGKTDVYASAITQLILDTSSYFAP